MRGDKDRNEVGNGRPAKHVIQMGANPSFLTTWDEVVQEVELFIPCS